MSPIVPTTVCALVPVGAVLRAARRAPLDRLRRGERGMATVEYAIGIVLVIAVIAAVIFAVQSNTFSQLLDELLRALMNYVKGVFTSDSFAIGKKP